MGYFVVAELERALRHQTFLYFKTGKLILF